nr:uncharacterized protein LOC111112446 isoform X3 [Crassostrea virginica]
MNESKFTVKDALKYDRIKINVRADGSSTYNKLTYNVVKTEKYIGDNVSISWTAPFFPKSGNYEIYHTKANKSEKIIRIDSKGFIVTNQSKYTYKSLPYNSTNISFEIKDITLNDAGYYVAGSQTDTALSGGGVVLIVLGKPQKPEIKGNLNVSVGDNANLTCSSKPTSTPDYYARLVTLSYNWFENNTKLDETQKTLALKVSRNHRFNQYSCEAKHRLKSVRSDPVRVNPLYKPESVSIIPSVDTLTVKEGGDIGPYSCSTDCNPPCVITWRYRDKDGNFHEEKSHNQTLNQQMVNRSFSVFECIANYADNFTRSAHFNLNVQYLDKPMPYVNGVSVLDPDRQVHVKENTSLLLSCHVNGCPNPIIRLKRNTGTFIISRTDSKEWLNHTIASSQCSDTDIYTCIGNSTVFQNKKSTFRVNVTCEPRLDESRLITTMYGSMSGQNVKVPVAVPVIANPPPQDSGIAWNGPSTTHSIISAVSMQHVPYKHWINSSIPILDRNYFGNYTLKYNGNGIITLFINPEDVPQVPSNFTGYSYASGYINVTWVSEFDGGKQQYFILSIKVGLEWKKVANLSDPGQGKVVYFESERLNAGQEYWFQLKSCNIINCSKESPEITITVKAETRMSVLLNKTFVIGFSSAVIILIVTIILVLAILKRRTALNRQDNQQDGAEISDQPDVVLYAAVDKSALKKNQNKADVVAEDVPEKKDETDTLYAVVEKKTTTEAKPSATKPESEQKNESKRERQKGATAAEATGASGTSRNVNQDGLIYIDVDFAKKPENKDKNEKPKIHGEEDRTEYTFVDFSKKAPVVKEKSKKEEEK